MLCMLFASDHALSFTEPARIISEPVPYSVVRGATVSITCVACGEFPVNINWLRESGHLILDNSTNSRVTVSELQMIHEGRHFVQSSLEIYRVEKEDESEYVCVATNEFGSDNATFRVTVEGKFYCDTE